MTKTFCDLCKSEIGRDEPLYTFESVPTRNECEQPAYRYVHVCGCCAAQIRRKVTELVRP